MLISLIILFAILGSIGSLLMAGVFLLIKQKTQKVILPNLISYSTGTLLASAFLGMIPLALEHISILKVLSSTLIGIILFFILEKLIIWRHCHKENCEVHSTAGPLILIGDAFHNFVDGIVIAASFLTSAPIGIAVSLSIISHEIPQEVGDFGILINSGYSRKKALFLNLLSSLSTLPAAVLSYFALERMQNTTPYVISISAASFIYIAPVDLTPELHKQVGIIYSVRQLMFLIAGIITIILVL